MSARRGRRRRAVGIALAGFAVLVGSSRFARAAAAVVAFAPPGIGQAGLAVGFDERGALRAVTCDAMPCALGRGVEVAFPAELQGAVAGAQLAVVGIGEGRRAIVVRLGAPKSVEHWAAVLVGALGAGRPSVVFSGVTGFSQGEEGTRRGKEVEVSPPDDSGARRIVIGDVAEDLSLCGRRALLAPELLANSDLKLHPAKVQRLGVEERERARHVVAVRVPEQALPKNAAASASVLRAVAATSAVGDPAALTDGDPDTTWAENRGGSGRGEFAVLAAPPELPLSGLEFVVRPPKARVEAGGSAREFWLASPRDLVLVAMPEDAWRFPGARYRVRLEPPLQGDCLALVSESAFDEKLTAQVTFAEVRALTEFDSASVPELVAALAGGNERSQAAGSLLRVGGPAAFAAVAKAFSGLDEGGRRVALELVDQAPCATSSPVYLAAIAGPFRAQRVHARDRLRRCGEAAAPSLARAVREARGPLQLDLLDELRLADAAACVDALGPLLDVESRRQRAALRVVLARASLNESGARRIRAALGDPQLGSRAALEVLRALGERVREFEPEASAALMRVQASDNGFATRYLLLEPLSQLAVRDASLRAAVSRALVSEPDPRLRARALSALRDPREFSNEVRQALSDRDVRVREAAVRASSSLPDATPAVSERLLHDPWPLVRMAAADALASTRQSVAADAALVRALDEDDSPPVRARVVSALGAQRARSQIPKIRERLTDGDEYPMVRAQAATALARLCDQSSLDTLTGFARKLADPLADERAHMVGAAALLALGELRPPDLKARLEPLLRPSSPAQARQAADAVLHRSGRCPAGPR